MPNIGGDFGFAQWPQVIPRNNTLCELPQFRPFKHRRQFGLTQQYDLQQLALVGFQIGE